MKNEDQSDNPSFYEIVKKSVAISFGVFLAYSVFIYVVRYTFEIDHGKFGDAFGGLNALAAFLGFTMISYSIYYQRKDFNAQIEHIKISNDQFLRQADLMEIEQSHRVEKAAPLFKVPSGRKFSSILFKEADEGPSDRVRYKQLEVKLQNIGGLAKMVHHRIAFGDGFDHNVLTAVKQRYQLIEENEIITIKLKLSSDCYKAKNDWPEMVSLRFTAIGYFDSVIRFDLFIDIHQQLAEISYPKEIAKELLL